MAGRDLERLALVTVLAGVTGFTAVPAMAGGTVAFDRPELQAPNTLTVSVNDVAPGGNIPLKFTADGKNISPATHWSGGPPGTRSYVLIVQDPDAPGAEPAVHWLVYDIAAHFQAVSGGMRNLAEATNPLGAAQGWNYHGSVGYSGPRPPVGDPAHHYHFQVFALDKVLRVAPGAHVERVLGAMKGHVIARGEVVGTYVAPQPKDGPKP